MGFKGPEVQILSSRPRCHDAHIAQSAERVLGKDEVSSSILLVGSRVMPGRPQGRLFQRFSDAALGLEKVLDCLQCCSVIIFFPRASCFCLWDFFLEVGSFFVGGWKKSLTGSGWSL